MASKKDKGRAGAAEAAPKSLHVSDIPVRIAQPNSASEIQQWVQVVEMWRSGMLLAAKDSPGAPHLKEAARFVREVRRGLQAGNAEQAAWAAVRLMHELWMAQTLDARKMIDGGVSAYRAAERENNRRAEIASARREGWRDAAAAIWERHPGWSASRVADEVAKATGDNAGTIRKALRK